MKKLENPILDLGDEEMILHGGLTLIMAGEQPAEVHVIYACRQHLLNVLAEAGIRTEHLNPEVIE